MIVPALTCLLFAYSMASQTYPGTSSRPILNSTEASFLEISDYLQGWKPDNISTSTADFTVGTEGYSTIQAAINDAIKGGGTSRKYIKVSAGIYNEVVYIPDTTTPLTIYGASNNAADTVISLNISANLPGSIYKDIVGHLFSSGDPAYSVFRNCARQTTIGTSCSSVFWIKAANVQIVDLTIENSSKDHQSVALTTADDKVQVHNARLLGHQDTFCAGSRSGIAVRYYVTNTYIEGDTDFVYGGGSAIFENCTFHSKADRKNNSVVFAPETHPSHPYGFLVIKSTITGDSIYFESKKVSLARAWDSGISSASDYVPGTSANGQLLIRESTIEAVISTDSPYAKAASSGREYSGNISGGRDLNDNTFNRFWEYDNTENI